VPDASGGHQELIVQGAAQLPQGAAHRRLRHVEGLRRARDALGAQQFMQHRQQVEIDLAQPGRELALTRRLLDRFRHRGHRRSP
jgi:hypothetical protein